MPSPRLRIPRAAAALCVAAAALLSVSRPAAGQVTVERLNDLSLGRLVAGTGREIRPDEAAAGRFRIQAPPGASIAVIAVLPGSLAGPTGTVGVSFGSVSGAWSASNDIAASTPFDPSQELRLTVPPGGAVYLWLGALLTVSSGQAAGSYSGTVTLSARAS